MSFGEGKKATMGFPLLVTEVVKDQPDPNMISIAITGMIIVFCALTILTLFLTALPKILGVVNKHFPPTEHGHSQAPVTKQEVLEDDLVAALAVALLHHKSD